MAKLIILQDISGNRHAVNPAFVTAIEQETYASGRSVRKVWVKGRAGYGTFSVDMAETVDALVALLGGGRS